MTEKTKQQEQASMESMQTGIPSDQQYEYWEHKSSGKIYAVKSEHGTPSFHGPLSESQKSSSPEGFTYSSNPEIVSKASEFEKLSFSEMRNRLTQKKSQSTSSQS